MAKRRCKGKTKRGTRCTRRGVEWCPQHADQAPAAPAQAHTDRTPKNARARKRKDEDWRPRFLAAFDEHITVSAACVVAGVGRSTVYDERHRNADFAEAWSAVEERTTERMEREGFRRAVEGWIEREEFDTDPETGERVATLRVRKFSDTLLIFFLKARRPGTYRERVEHTGVGGGPLEHRVKVDLSKLTDEQLDALEALHGQDGRDPEPG